MNGDDRGQIKRVSFEILYPSGQLKQIHMGIGGIPRWEGAGLIVWSEQLLRDVVAPGLGGRYQSAEEALEKWNTNEGVFKPAMLVVKDDGSVDAMCGNHHRIWRPGTPRGGSPLWPDEPE